MDPETLLKALDQPAGPLAPPQCITCDAAPVARFGYRCASCLEQFSRQERGEALRRAWDSVPDTLRWADFAAAKCAEWVPDADAVAAARAAIDRPLVTLVGDMRAGKTTLACCMLREHMRRGARRDASSRDVAHARRARFVHAYALLRERAETRLGDDHMPLIDVCTRASVLVVDELGGDAMRDDHGVLFALLHERHARGRATIVTTFLSREQCATRYGGIAGRLFDDGLVIRVRKVAALRKAAP